MTAPVAAPEAAPPAARWWAQTRLELMLTLRRGESLLLTFAIPVGVLAFFSLVHVLPTGAEDDVDFLVPGVLALAVLSTALVSTAIATGFERQYGVLKRLGATPLRRRELIAAKTTSVLAIQVIQVAVLAVEGVILGFRPSGTSVLAAVAGAVLATVAFAGLGLLLAGTLPALTTLALANGIYLVLLLISGMVFPLSKLPGPLRTFAELLPSGALAEVFHGALGPGTVPGRAWVVLVAWAVAAPLAAARWFRWE